VVQVPLPASTAASSLNSTLMFSPTMLSEKRVPLMERDALAVLVAVGGNRKLGHPSGDWMAKAPGRSRRRALRRAAGCPPGPLRTRESRVTRSLAALNPLCSPPATFPVPSLTADATASASLCGVIVGSLPASRRIGLSTVALLLSLVRQQEGRWPGQDGPSASMWVC
jgi:hypothetical protein